MEHANRLGPQNRDLDQVSVLSKDLLQVEVTSC